MSQPFYYFTLASENAKPPHRAHHTDAGADLFADIPTAKLIAPGELGKIPLGVKITPPPGHVILLLEKSGLAEREGVHIMGGVMDEGYTGEYTALVRNTSRKPLVVEPGQKVCQMVILPVLYAEGIEVPELPESARGEKGFGSTGR